MNVTYFMETQNLDTDGLRVYERELALPPNQKAPPRSHGTSALMGLMGGQG